MRLGDTALLVAITLVACFTATHRTLEASDTNLHLVGEGSHFLRSVNYQAANEETATRYGNNGKHRRIATATSNQNTEERGGLSDLSSSVKNTAVLGKVESSLKNTVALEKVESSVKKVNAFAKIKSVLPNGLGFVKKFKKERSFNKLTGFLETKPSLAQTKAFVEKNPDITKLKTLEISATITKKDVKRAMPLFAKSVGNNSLLWDFLIFVLTPPVFLAATIAIAVKSLKS
ncbi:hypothetical protein PC129_g22013 [Phytophthora cactorum]|uniref:RxLR effector protein n=1 Tax=Phytophthora cactorum TaxID=29920 RepID=A0A329RCB3_9STRA|nr:hypothetical protein Pcac1_g25838 [Phytophthora cactorum]KAG2795614.1 hypothetical protein PC112_g22561 [Phytophthora cactorum]KAG2796055.1 hypothetical protein PC111_g21890 [Phytophthora cactorum]KAG2826350.1 hypothetical protein PC113_g21789 [Phytophthora cactorum]KAG2875390.1 hypothetical protein PC114_g24755 [Phytophthora cactorum]